jgi:hypothetical protein
MMQETFRQKCKKEPCRTFYNNYKDLRNSNRNITSFLDKVARDFWTLEERI